jgi:hypothetical protein
MAYTAEQLIEKSFYLSGVVARSLQTPTGEQISLGLDLLNALLDFKQIETDLIPYWQYIEMPCVQNQEYYFLPYVVAVESATFNLSVIRYGMRSNSRTAYTGSPRVDNISSLPFSYNFNRCIGGGNLGVYFLPNTNYPLKMMVKIFLSNVALNTDLTNISELVPYTFINTDNQGFDSGYIEYLRYGLAAKICEEYGVSMNPEAMRTLTAYERKLMYVSPPDLIMQKSSMLNASKTPTLNMGFVNLSNGFVPS